MSILKTATGKEIDVDSVLCDETSSLLYVILPKNDYMKALQVFGDPNETKVLEYKLTRYEGFTSLRGMNMHGVNGLRVNLGAE